MQIVINIPEEEYDMFRIMYSSGMGNSAVKRILNGTLLPQHGRLIDADAITISPTQFDTGNDAIVAVNIIDNVPTIVERSEE